MLGGNVSVPITFLEAVALPAFSTFVARQYRAPPLQYDILGGAGAVPVGQHAPLSQGDVLGGAVAFFKAVAFHEPPAVYLAQGTCGSGLRRVQQLERGRRAAAADQWCRSVRACCSLLSSAPPLPLADKVVVATWMINRADYRLGQMRGHRCAGTERRGHKLKATGLQHDRNTSQRAKVQSSADTLALGVTYTLLWV